MEPPTPEGPEAQRPGLCGESLRAFLSRRPQVRPRLLFLYKTETSFLLPTFTLVAVGAYLSFPCLSHCRGGGTAPPLLPLCYPDAPTVAPATRIPFFCSTNLFPCLGPTFCPQTSSILRCHLSSLTVSTFPRDLWRATPHTSANPALCVHSAPVALRSPMSCQNRVLSPLVSVLYLTL